MEGNNPVRLDLLNLRPLSGLSLRDKHELPVSVDVLPDGTPFVVSRYGDPVWDFYPGIPQENLTAHQKRINWHIALPDGALLTDERHATLLESTKDFIWSLFADPVEGRKRPILLTLRHRVRDIKPLLCWMVSVGIDRFASLSGLTTEYALFAKQGKHGNAIAPQTVKCRLLVVEDIYRQRDKLGDALRTHPWPHETACSLAGDSGGMGRKPKTDVIPDVVACQLCDAVLLYVRDRSAGILAALQACEDAARTKSADTRYGDYAPGLARTQTARAAGYAGYTELTEEATRLRTACYIGIDMFSGIRNSEVMSISERCIASGKSADGTTDVFWLHGTIYKTGRRPKRWLVPPIVKEIVEVLSRLTLPLRETLRREGVELADCMSSTIAKERARLAKRLSTVRDHKEKLFLSRSLSTKNGLIAVLSGTAMNRDIKKFCNDMHICASSGIPYPLHTHQFRRTYAYFMARSELGDLLTLRDHFGHWSIDMTTYYADGAADEYESDTELLEMVATEKAARQTEIMASYLNSDAPLANGDHWLKDWRSSIRTAANKEELIREYADTITLNGTGHSWCVGNAKGSGCGGLCVFEAQMCVDCNYGIIGPEHRPVWEGIRDQQMEALALDDMGPGGRARAQQILGYAEKVLRRLDGQEMAA